jgi:predicted nucleotidyltransferase
MNPIHDPRVRDQVAMHPHRLVFASLSGAHLYGFPSHDSDVDIRGAHVLPPAEVLRLAAPAETYELMDVVDGLEVDVVTYDLKKFCLLLLNKNGNVLEQLVSPLVVLTSPEHEELRGLATRCVCTHHVHHYRGMTKNRLRAFGQGYEVKPLLYAFRAALTGIHLLSTGECQPDLSKLAPIYDVGFVDELIDLKTSGEHVTLDGAEAPKWVDEVEALLGRLEAAFEASKLPEAPTAQAEVDDFLVRLRLQP